MEWNEGEGADVVTGRDSASGWYKDAVIYQLHVRSFCDSNEDGVGDFRGLVTKLDYLQGLGVTAIWLQPFFVSPMRDDGYDIADYTAINPVYGDLDEFTRFLEEAHQRDLRIITEMVMNHTSDRHDWFQKSRRAQPGEEWRDFYVWSHDDRRYAEARVVFGEFETSNWTWDPVAQAYFWHRFYHHQPDLNFDHPPVRAAMMDAVDFWLGLGVDGLRLDAVPYLFEREGTTCENLPETHAFLRELRKHVDERHSEKVLLAEANQWPEDAAAYFGDGDECHMNFHFPLMPRLFMAVEREDRFPVIDILEQTPPIPENCQWGVFLRNHDELTLEMVTDEERDYMYRTYAGNQRARVNLGIRRRLAPLLRDNRRKMELMNALLLSLPGTPILYYGDEICMGDNVYLGDRDAVRTPMQWSDDRNGGFSRANPQQVYLPTIVDPLFHYASRNVQVEHSRPHSMLWWVRRIISLRKRFLAFGRGDIRFLAPTNPKVLAYLRRSGEEIILVVANLSRYSQFAELDLVDYRGRVPLELFGQTRFPPIGELPYLLTLGPYSFHWFQLKWLREDSEAMDVKTPEIQLAGAWSSLFTGRWQKEFEATLPQFLNRARWFAGKARQIRRISLLDALENSGPVDGESGWTMIIFQVDYLEGESEVYTLPLVFACGRLERDLAGDHPGTVVALLSGPQPAMLCEANWTDSFWRVLGQAVGGDRSLGRGKGTIQVVREALSEGLRGDVSGKVTILGAEQSNASAVLGERLVVKLFRQIWEGENPELEIGRVLTAAKFQGAPRLVAGVNYLGPDGTKRTLASAFEYIDNEGSGWSYTLDELGRYLEAIQLSVDGSMGNVALSLPDEWDLSSYLHSIELLGRRTGELHVVLAGAPDAAFTPEAFTTLYQRNLYEAMRSEARRTLALLTSVRHHLDAVSCDLVERLLRREDVLLEQYRVLARHRIRAKRIRCHGDFHLGQVLFTGREFVIIDFEGETGRPVSERRIKASPLSDVAGMLRSFHYAASAALRLPRNESLRASVPAGVLEARLRRWQRLTTDRFLAGYFHTAEQGAFLPEEEEDRQIVLTAYVLRKAVYELRYELNNRPEWVSIPLEGLLAILEIEA